MEDTIMGAVENHKKCEGCIRSFYCFFNALFSKIFLTKTPQTANKNN